jgi:MoxR-like ATPase
VNQVVSVEQILRAQEAVRGYMDEKIENTFWYCFFATRFPEKYKLADLKPLISFGASPRGSINLANAAKCAFIKRRLCYPEDAPCTWCLRQSRYYYEAEAENITSVDIINKIINEVEVP